jgi:chromosome segregation ATPase
MVNSREMAEQAFSLLQDALKDSEARAVELDAELKKQRSPRNSVEEQALVLEHRIEAVEVEREHWKQQAGQVAEVLENERAKLRKLKKRLEIAESGPNSVEKKEVNFWRSRAEEFDKDTKEYKQRIAALRKELNARPKDADAIDPVLLEQLETTRQEALERKIEVEHLKAEAERQLAESNRQKSEFDRRAGGARALRNDARRLAQAFRYARRGSCEARRPR